MEILGWIIFGAVAGWIANAVMGRQGGGCMVHVALGLAGAVVGGFLFRALSGRFAYAEHGILASMLVAVIGAVIVLAVWNAVAGRRY